MARELSTFDSTVVDRTYENAVKLLDSRRRIARPKNATAPTKSQQHVSSSSGTPDLRGSPGIVGMSEWLEMLGHSMEDINALNVIHIAGTKGKGSTCAFTESFLRAHGIRTGFPRKTGLYTSPHLILPEERIRIDSEPLSEAFFAKYFFEVFDKLPQLAIEYDFTKAVVERGPRFLQLYALFALHVFIREGVDVAILETHSGGEYDATNIVERPIVTAVTSLGMDHIDMLGPTIENIAWHKAGIYKSNAVALSTVQDPGPAGVLKSRASNKSEEIQFVDIDDRLPIDEVQLKPTVQKKNASLAVAAAEAFLHRRAPVDSQILTVDDIRSGVQQWSWPGRFQIIPDGNLTWFLDAAHNDMSVEIAAQWFADGAEHLNDAAIRILIFSHISELRDAPGVLRTLSEALKDTGIDMSHVIFTTYDETEEKKSFSIPESSALFHDIWLDSFPKSRIIDESTIQGAVRLVQGLSRQQTTQVLVTGSQHLVGPALRILQGH